MFMLELKSICDVTNSFTLESVWRFDYINYTCKAVLKFVTAKLFYMQ